MKKTAKKRRKSAGSPRNSTERPQVRHALDGVITAQEFTEILGLTDQRLRELAAEGMPKASRGKYPLRDATRFYVDKLRGRVERRESDGPSKSDLERDILLEKLKVQRGEVFQREEVFAVWRAAFTRLDKALETLATQIGRELNLTGEDVKMIRERVDEMRNAFVDDSKEYADPVKEADNGDTAAA